MNIDPDLPIVLGFAGIRATGKTVTGDALGTQLNVTFTKEPSVSWDHLFYALPIYRIVAARQKIEGEHAEERMYYEIHDALVDIFGGSPLYGAPPYKQLIDMVNEIMSLSCPKEGKARTFMQLVGTEMCRAYDPDCWVKWMDRKIKKNQASFLGRVERERSIKEAAEEDSALDLFTPYYGAIISDCRFVNEAQFVKDHPNGILVKFWARPEVIIEREIERDGYSASKSESSHVSENSIDDIPGDWFDFVLDTSDISVEQQVEAVKTLITMHTGLINV